MKRKEKLMNKRKANQNWVTQMKNLMKSNEISKIFLSESKIQEVCKKSRKIRNMHSGSQVKMQAWLTGILQVKL